MPVKLFKIKSGKVEEVINDSRVKLLNCDTGDTLDAFQMKKALVRDFFFGSGYIYIEKNRNETTGLYYVDSSYVVVNYNFEPIYKDYTIFVEKDSFKPYEFIKLLRNTTNGAYGVSITDELSVETASGTSADSVTSSPEKEGSGIEGDSSAISNSSAVSGTFGAS